MLIITLVFAATLFLAYVNGANDNFKGVATLFGSGAADYKKALFWATITTFLGSLAALLVSTKLVVMFSGKGLVPDSIVNTPYFLLSVGLGASLTIFIATLTGIPVSTTHSLIGALLGAGLLSSGAEVNFSALGMKFFIPLLASPVIAAFFTIALYRCFKYGRVSLGVEREMCLCVGEKVEPLCIKSDGTAVLDSTGSTVTVDQLENCQQRYNGQILGFDSQSLLDKVHYLSAGAVCFARGLNDAPKIVALLLVVKAFSMNWGIPIVAVAMALGGILNAKKVALTMSKGITKMNHGQGFTANLVTAILVIFASKWGIPVSTTHVSCGSIFGIGLLSREANTGVMSNIALAWILTLPVAAVLSAGSYFLLKFSG